MRSVVRKSFEPICRPVLYEAEYLRSPALYKSSHGLVNESRMTPSIHQPSDKTDWHGL